jgi:hypothetical protein
MMETRPTIAIAATLFFVSFTTSYCRWSTLLAFDDLLFGSTSQALAVDVPNVRMHA